MSTIITITNYFLWFILYSVVGWILETALYAIRDKKSVKRGFLFGPLCPIYGTGAIICTLFLYGRITNFFALFGAGFALCTVIEYLTHFILEKVFHSMWWDYSNQKFNIKGRVCLKSSLLFGLGVAVLLEYIQPFVEYVTYTIPLDARLFAAFIIYSILIVDIAITVESLKSIVKTLKELQKFIIDNMQESIDQTDEKVDVLVGHIKSIPPTTDEKLEQIKAKIRSNEHMQNLVDRMRNDNPQARRIIGIFPRLQLKEYKESLEIIFSRTADNKTKGKKNKKENKSKKDKH
jgi:uncharacterized membrane protein